MVDGNPVGRPLTDLPTPCLLLDEARMDRNIARMRDRLRGFGVSFRPHLKTAKSIPIAKRLMASDRGPCTVSTLHEAETFAASGVTDICYAVGIAPGKLPRVMDLLARGVNISIILDDVVQAEAVVDAAQLAGRQVPVLIEIDSDGRRGGIPPEDEARILAVGRALALDGGDLRGVLTHAGASYGARSDEELRAYAERERVAAVRAASTLRRAGFACPVVSVGSTPTALFAETMEGVTEVRAGVFVFFDLAMRAAGVCRTDDIALSVMATVIGRRSSADGWLIDAGWTALSRDLGAGGEGYGLVCNVAGQPLGDLIVAETSQEHGLIISRSGDACGNALLRQGDRVRILPNHACAMAAQHDRYFVMAGTPARIGAVWPRFGGW